MKVKAGLHSSRNIAAVLPFVFPFACLTAVLCIGVLASPLQIRVAVRWSSYLNTRVLGNKGKMFLLLNCLWCDQFLY